MRQVIGLLGVLSFAQSVYAAEATSIFDLPLESLVQLPVSVASPLEDNATNAAAAVSVLHPADWQQQSASSLAQAIERLPSVAVYSSLNSAPMFAIRGYANEISVRGIASLLDDVPLNNFSYATSAYDLPFPSLDLLTRVEMIRGSGSTLYGSDAFHGVLSLHTWADEEDDSMTGMARASVTQRGSTQLALRDRLTGAGWQAQAGVAAEHQANQALNYNYHDALTGLLETGQRQYGLTNKTAMFHLLMGDAEQSTGSLRLDLYANESHTTDFSGVGTQFYTSMAGKYAAYNLNFSANRDVSHEDSQFWLSQLRYDKTLTEQDSLQLRLYQWQADQTWTFNLSEYPTSLVRLSDGQSVPCRTSVTQSAASALQLFCPHNLYQGTQDSRQGLQALWRHQPDAGTQWAIGAGRDWMAVDQAYIRRIALSGVVYLDNDTPFSDVGRQINYLFLHARTSLLPERLGLVYGVRWDDYSDVGQAVSPRLALIFQPNQQWTGKLLFNQAFRAPSAVERYGSGAGSQQVGNPHIKPETIETWEMLWQYQHRKGVSELSLFSSRWQDGIILVPVSSSQNQYQNSGLNLAYGVELQHEYAWRNWHIQGNASWVKSWNNQTNMAYSAFPQYLLNLSIGRDWGDHWQVALHQRVMLDYTTTDTLAHQPTYDAPDYWRMDVHLQKQQGPWRYWADVRNLFDRKNIISATFNSEGGIPDERLSIRVGAEWCW